MSHPFFIKHFNLTMKIDFINLIIIIFFNFKQLNLLFCLNIYFEKIILSLNFLLNFKLYFEFFIINLFHQIFIHLFKNFLIKINF
jgi:hypothetical protein